MTKEDLKNLGINVEDLTYPFGDMNIIVQCFSKSLKKIEKEDSKISPILYHQRKNNVWCEKDNISIETEEEKNDYIKHLKDSVGRLRILALILEKQAKELEENGYLTTKCYYPDLSEIGYEN